MPGLPNITLAKIPEILVNSSMVNGESKQLGLFSSSLYGRNDFFDDSSQPSVYIRNNVFTFVFNTNLGGVFILPLLLNNDIKYYEEKSPVSCRFNVRKDYIGRVRTVQCIRSFSDNDIDEAVFKKLFNELYKEWREETRFDSFIGDPYHKCYNNIVQLGYRVVPYIITKLKEDPSLIFTALTRITGENPIQEENRGIVKKMAGDWIDWWEKKNNAIEHDSPDVLNGPQYGSASVFMKRKIN